MEAGRGSSRKQTKSKRHGKLDDIPARRAFHKFFILVAILASLSALCMAAGQILGIFIYENGPVQHALRGYVLILCVLVILIEIEWPTAIHETFLFRNWISRGLLYVFIGVIGMQESDTSEIVESDKMETYETIADIVVAVAWNMIGLGCLYLLMGMLCLQYALNRLRNDYQARLARAKERQQENEIDENEMDETSVGVEVTAEQSAIEAAQSAFAGNEVDVEWAKEAEDESSSQTKTQKDDGRDEESWTENASTEEAEDESSSQTKTQKDDGRESSKKGDDEESWTQNTSSEDEAIEVVASKDDAESLTQNTSEDLGKYEPQLEKDGEKLLSQKTSEKEAKKENLITEDDGASLTRKSPVDAEDVEQLVRQSSVDDSPTGEENEHRQDESSLGSV